MFNDTGYQSPFAHSSTEQEHTASAFRAEQFDANGHAVSLTVCAGGLVRQGMKYLLKEVCLTKTALTELSGFNDAMPDGRGVTDADFLIVDLDDCGLPALREVCAGANARCNIVVLVASASREVVEACDMLGVKGLITKCMPLIQMGLALDLILMGGVYYPRTSPDAAAATQARTHAAQHQPLAVAVQSKLTEREEDVLALVLNGMSNKTIARRLDIALGTVKNYVAALLRKCGANSRQELISMLLRQKAN